MTPPMEQHTLNHLIREGITTHDRVTSKPVNRRCAKCKQPIISALDDGVRTDLHPATLTPYGELLAIMCGDITFTATKEWVVYRSAIDIKCKPADKVNVHHLHNCTNIHPYHYRHPPQEAPRKRTPADAPPPF